MPATLDADTMDALSRLGVENQKLVDAEYIAEFRRIEGLLQRMEDTNTHELPA